jgi:hypothetical protein
VKKNLLNVVRDSSLLHMASQSALQSERDAVADLSRGLVASAASIRASLAGFVETLEVSSEDGTADLVEAMLDLDQTLRGHVVALVELAREFFSLPVGSVPQDKKEQAANVSKLIGSVARCERRHCFLNRSCKLAPTTFRGNFPLLTLFTTGT